MIIEIKIHSSFQQYVSKTEKQLDGDKWDIQEKATVRQVLEMLNIPEKEASILLINGRSAHLGDRLSQGDVFAAFPVLSGG